MMQYNNRVAINTGYSPDYFIQLFTAIDYQFWTTRVFQHGNQCCALGHCGHTVERNTEQGLALCNLFSRYCDYSVVTVNDGKIGIYNQDHPKDRILAALQDIKINRELGENY